MDERTRLAYVKLVEEMDDDPESWLQDDFRVFKRGKTFFYSGYKFVNPRVMDSNDEWVTQYTEVEILKRVKVPRWIVSEMRLEG